jgi:hypothetical protein
VNVKQLAIRALQDRSFGKDSPIVRMLDGVFNGIETELNPEGCMSCVRDRLKRWLNNAVEEGRLLNYRIDDLRVVGDTIEGTILIMPQPVLDRIDLTFNVTDRGVVFVTDRC